MSPVEITYFPDVLCIWAYVSQVRVDATKSKFGNDIDVKHRFCSVFGNTAQKISSSWKDKGGYEGFNAHFLEVAGKYPHVALHPELWLKIRPVTSASAHVFLKAAQLSDSEAAATSSPFPPNFCEQLMWEFRCAFFRDCRDISRG
jgi:predicted DsbA family dithiol-disulfide isomerase